MNFCLYLIIDCRSGRSFPECPEDSDVKTLFGLYLIIDCRSGRSFPECPEDSDVKTCTQDMDPVAFNTYTEFFTHAHSICHYLQSERWQQRAENTIHRLTESSAGVAEQLASTQRMAEDLVVAQSAALKSQESILRNGEELKSTLQDSTQGLRDVFAEMRHSAQEQQVAFAEIFNRVAFLQSFIMSETHTFSSLFYNALGFGASFLLTSVRRTAGARFFLFGLVALNIYLERMICKTVLESEDHVGLLRKSMVLIGCLVLLYFALRYRNISRESLEILKELKETRSDLQQALQKAGISKRTRHYETRSTSEALKRRQRHTSGSRSRTSSVTVYSVLVNDNEVLYINLYMYSFYRNVFIMWFLSRKIINFKVNNFRSLFNH
uniref:Brambleberry n=1 Tax=Sinocyclocheilus grahami TaxID=75366 RepID=A0A672MJ63_SINGR